MRGPSLGVAALLVGLCAVPRGARAEEPAEAVAVEPKRAAALSWVRLPGAEDCIDGTTLARRVEEKLGRPAFPAPREATLLVEGRAEKFDEAWALIRFERFEQVAELGFVEAFDELLQALDLRGLDGVGGGGQEFRIELAFLVPEGQGLGFGPIGLRERRLVFDFQHQPSSEGGLPAF